MYMHMIIYACLSMLLMPHHLLEAGETMPIHSVALMFTHDRLDLSMFIPGSYVPNMENQ